MNAKIKASIARHKWRLLVALIAVLVVVWLLIFHQQVITRETILEYGESLSALWLLVASLFLPLVGFPMTIILLLVGIRFGFWSGMMVVAVVMAFHHLIAFWIGHGKLRQWVHDKLQKWDYQIPKVGGRKPAIFTMIFAAIHGPPYMLKLYLLALTEVPFRFYLWVGWPVYLLFASIPVAAGSSLIDFDPTWIYVLIGAATVLTVAGKWLQKKYERTAEDREETQ